MRRRCDISHMHVADGQKRQSSRAHSDVMFNVASGKSDNEAFQLFIISAYFMLFKCAYTNMHMQQLQFHVQKNRKDTILTDREGGLCDSLTRTSEPPLEPREPTEFTQNHSRDKNTHLLAGPVSIQTSASCQ